MSLVSQNEWTAWLLGGTISFRYRWCGGSEGPYGMENVRKKRKKKYACFSLTESFFSCLLCVVRTLIIAPPPSSPVSPLTGFGWREIYPLPYLATGKKKTAPPPLAIYTLPALLSGEVRLSLISLLHGQSLLSLACTIAFAPPLSFPTPCFLCSQEPQWIVVPYEMNGRKVEIACDE